MKHIGYVPMLFLVGQSLAAQTDRPNVVVFLVDDMGLMDTSLPFLTDKNGNEVRHPLNEWYRTPNMERMARQGIRFSTFYAQSVSSPSRASIITGQNAARHRTTNWINPENNNRTPFGPRGWNWDGISKKTPTLPRVLQQAGYKTIHVGKAHFGRIGSEGEDPLNVGFDVNIAGSSIGHAGSYYGEHGYGHIKGQKARAVPGLKKYHGTNTFLSDALTLEANDQIDKAVAERKPFFLYMGTQDVHVPRVPHPRFAGKSGLGTRGDVILQLDWTIGEIMNTLDSLQLTDNTIFIFTSDNGPVIDDGYQDQAFELLNGHTPMGIYRGGKYSAYEAGTRIPFILRWPAKVKPNKQQALFSQIDVYASLAALLKQPLPKGAAPDSQEHLNTLLGKDDANREYIVQQNLNNTLAIVKGQWKYIEPSDAPAIEYWTRMELGNDRQPQLYDLSSDPSEKNNVAKLHPEAVRELSELLKSVKTR